MESKKDSPNFRSLSAIVFFLIRIFISIFQRPEKSLSLRLHFKTIRGVTLKIPGNFIHLNADIYISMGVNLH